MTLEGWLYSARRAWQRPLLKWTTVATGLLVVASTLFFLWNMILARQQNGTVILHYNIYLGIDEVRPWWWLFFLPAIWIVLTVVDLFLAYGSYQHDPQFAGSLVFLAFLFSLPCMGAFYYLVRMNV